MKRLFVAVPVADKVKEKINQLLQELAHSGADLKLVAAENLHFTLKFLGDVEENKIPEIIEKLSLIKHKPFSISLHGVGVFPSLERINTVWVTAKSLELVLLTKRANQLLDYIRREEREEVPHLTVARVKSGRNKERLKEIVEKNKLTAFGEMLVDKIVLFESELRKEGPKHKTFKEFWLQ